MACARRIGHHLRKNFLKRIPNKGLRVIAVESPTAPFRLEDLLHGKHGKCAIFLAMVLACVCYSSEEQAYSPAIIGEGMYILKTLFNDGFRFNQWSTKIDLDPEVPATISEHFQKNSTPFLAKHLAVLTVALIFIQADANCTTVESCLAL